MRIFIDANTLISGIVFKGYEHEVMKLAAKKKAELITSEDVLQEVLGVLQRKFPSKAYLIEEFLKLSEIKIITKTNYRKLIEHQNIENKEDLHVLAAAIASNSEQIVTGDKQLLELKTYKGIKIVRSTQLLSQF